MTGFTTDVGRVAGQLPDALAILGHDGCVSWVNQAAVDLFARDATHWIGRPLVELLHPDDRAHATATLGAPSTTAPPDGVVVRVRRGDDAWQGSELRGRHVRGGDEDRDFTVILMRHAAT